MGFGLRYYAELRSKHKEVFWRVEIAERGFVGQSEEMNESVSPLRQVYIDMERFYAVYSDPTYRDVLELCLRPFAGQIFQSYGALHIRRTVSLYNDTRPMSFYSVGKEFPVGWIITANGQHLETHTGEPIITESTRERIESMWENDINVQGESVMDIVPAIRKVSVGVKNKMMTNIISQMGLYNMDNWHDPEEFLVLQNENTLRFTGDSDKQGWIINFKGYPVQQCSYTLTLEYNLKIGISRYSSLGSGRPADVELIVEYGFKLVGASITYWLMDDGTWTSREELLEDKIKLSVDVNKKIEVKGFPMSGQFVMVIKQNLKGYSSGRNAYFESFYISDIKMEIDTGDDYENSLKYEVFSNPANNVDMSVSLPIADIPNIPNDQLIYSLYFTDYYGKPTRMWRSKGGNDYNSLVNHIVACALRYKQLPGKRIGGEMFTGKHIDMNTVVDGRSIRVVD